MKTETHRAVPWQRKQPLRLTLFPKNKKRKLSLQANQVSFFPKKRKKTPFAVRVLPCVFQGGSLTAEAAMVLPLFLLAMLAVFGYIPAYAKQMNTTQKLLETAESAALYRTLDEKCGSDGSLRKVYCYSPVMRFPGIGSLWLTAEVKVRPWTGYDGDLGKEGGGVDSRIVYISDNREVYHTSPDCSYLAIRLTSMTIGRAKAAVNAMGEHYAACDKCCRGFSGSVVYVSEKGSHYHSSVECSGLSRSPEAVLLSSVENLPLCSRCGREQH